MAQANPFKSLLEAKPDVLWQWWVELPPADREAILEALNRQSIITDPELLTGLTLSRLGELSRMQGVMEIMADFIMNKLASDNPGSINDDGSINIF